MLSEDAGWFRYVWACLRVCVCVCVCGGAEVVSVFWWDFSELKASLPAAWWADFSLPIRSIIFVLNTLLIQLFLEP